MNSTLRLSSQIPTRLTLAHFNHIVTSAVKGTGHRPIHVGRWALNYGDSMELVSKYGSEDNSCCTLGGAGEAAVISLSKTVAK